MHFSFPTKQRNQNRLIVRNGEEKEGGRETRTQMMRMMRMLMTRIRRVAWTMTRTSRGTGRREQSSGR